MSEKKGYLTARHLRCVVIRVEIRGGLGLRGSRFLIPNLDAPQLTVTDHTRPNRVELCKIGISVGQTLQHRSRLVVRVIAVFVLRGLSVCKRCQKNTHQKHRDENLGPHGRLLYLSSMDLKISRGTLEDP